MSTLPPWSRRTPEEAALMNPAFMGTVVHHAVHGFEQESGLGMPFPLVFLVPPVVLVEGTRAVLPRRKDNSLAAWLQDHPNTRLRFGAIAGAMVPVVREGLLFAAAKAALALDGAGFRAGRLVRGSGAAVATNTNQFQEILRSARFVGKWYANAGTTETIMALWGVRP